MAAASVTIAAMSVGRGCVVNMNYGGIRLLVNDVTPELGQT